MGAESDVGGGSGKTLQSHGQLPPGKMRIGCGVELVSARTESCWENVLPNVQRCQRVSSNQAHLIVVVKCSPSLDPRNSDSPVTYPLTFLTAPRLGCTVRPLGSFLGSHQYAESSAKEDLCLSAEPFGPSQQPCASQPPSLSAHRESI